MGAKVWRRCVRKKGGKMQNEKGRKKRGGGKSRSPCLVFERGEDKKKKELRISLF